MIQTMSAPLIEFSLYRPDVTLRNGERARRIGEQQNETMIVPSKTTTSLQQPPAFRLLKQGTASCCND